MTADPRAETRWRTALDEHRAALEGYVRTAASLPEGAWSHPWQPGKWTPAQVTDHLAAAYRVLTAEADGSGPSMRVIVPPLKRRILRWLILPHILFHRSFPRRVPAPREIRPGEGQPRDAALSSLQSLADRFEAAAERARGQGSAGLTHPYFGTIDWTRGARFCAIHIEHHERQIARARGARNG